MDGSVSEVFIASANTNIQPIFFASCVIYVCKTSALMERKINNISNATWKHNAD